MNGPRLTTGYMNEERLVNRICEETGLYKSEGRIIIQAVWDCIGDELAAGHGVYIREVGYILPNKQTQPFKFRTSKKTGRQKPSTVSKYPYRGRLSFKITNTMRRRMREAEKNGIWPEGPKNMKRLCTEIKELNLKERTT